MIIIMYVCPIILWRLTLTWFICLVAANSWPKWSWAGFYAFDLVPSRLDFCFLTHFERRLLDLLLLVSFYRKDSSPHCPRLQCRRHRDFATAESPMSSELEFELLVVLVTAVLVVVVVVVVEDTPEDIR